jgi:hypothetical protein
VTTLTAYNIPALRRLILMGHFKREAIFMMIALACVVVLAVLIGYLLPFIIRLPK